jgi:hypothetical protein
MMQALKGAFMGYIGLLLNDPYKRDRIDGCMLDIFLSFVHVYLSLVLFGLYKPNYKIG